MFLYNSRFQIRNSATGVLGSQLTLAQGRRHGSGPQAGSNNGRRGVSEELFDSAYVQGMQDLVDEDLVTVDEVRSAFSLTTYKGPRTSGKVWEKLMKERNLKGREGTQQLRSGGDRFYRVQALVLEHFR